MLSGLLSPPGLYMGPVPQHSSLGSARCSCASFLTSSESSKSCLSPPCHNSFSGVSRVFCTSCFPFLTAATFYQTCLSIEPAKAEPEAGMQGRQGMETPDWGSCDAEKQQSKHEKTEKLELRCQRGSRNRGHQEKYKKYKFQFPGTLRES